MVFSKALSIAQTHSFKNRCYRPIKYYRIAQIAETRRTRAQRSSPCVVDDDTFTVSPRWKSLTVSDACLMA
ncbi:hypothetical protein BDN70DRAFT_875275 [Pholiota conissans]|uniref:Uncharacterized protein n=1 Tax=Pholiota conissans TaxID=109636 RepID=A0A9P5Z8L5_9AGAR|nr:hypothetical protein BDN70DRAFT_875275 [Pholiota conissans]